MYLYISYTTDESMRYIYFRIFTYYCNSHYPTRIRNNVYYYAKKQISSYYIKLGRSSVIMEVAELIKFSGTSNIDIYFRIFTYYCNSHYPTRMRNNVYYYAKKHISPYYIKLREEVSSSWK